ncbi:hypothetical protein BV22DRAFT_1051142 [Leucogyrophana mollusca]|uniref:Uncharacterized protein n=1 Tax=Leucogyrophana mollusca TaxID=85980 RepID=A0ACB8B193_9AGAM|nr:hypothetical protein BV22DRAFT_1051142 [Leucogyrophana mollusca]
MAAPLPPLTSLKPKPPLGAPQSRPATRASSAPPAVFPISQDQLQSKTKLHPQSPLQNVQPPSRGVQTRFESTKDGQSVSQESRELVSDGSQPGVLWDGWPDGDFQWFFTWDEAIQTNNLQERWACELKGGDKHGSANATSWENGKRTRRYFHKGSHTHECPTHLLHLTQNERARFEKLVDENPTAGPLSLLVGPRGRHGPQEGAGEISPVLLNADRIKAEMRQLKAAAGVQEWNEAFKVFKLKHKNWIVYSQVDDGEAGVVVMQTPFMASSLVKDHVGIDAVNGIVSDAAHRFWKNKKNLLIISSTYSPQLRCWVPGLMTWADGSSDEHYRIHFLFLFKAMAQVCEEREIDVTDDLFANVVDFSEAERSGYIQAFVDFWTKPDDLRSEGELHEAAAALLKGCQQHFRSQVTRVSKISGVVPPELKEHFQDRALSLLRVSDMETFNQTTAALLTDFPKIESWLCWWLWESHASMLFEPFRVMLGDLWQWIPNTTNAEEAMHWKIYQGIKMRYGAPEPWKDIRAEIGRTKRQRAPEAQVKSERFRAVKTSHPSSDLHQAMDFRMSLGVNHEAASKLLMVQRDGLRKNLLSCRIVLDPGDGTGTLTLTAERSKEYGGSLKKWFADLVQINRRAIKSAQCWRTMDGVPTCNGSADLLELFIQLPVMLVLDLVGLAFFSGTDGSHFMARYTPDGKHIFDYDGIRDGGMAHLVKGATISSHLTGISNEIPTPDGYHIYGIVYRLQGGIRAQNFFVHHQTQQATRVFGIHFDFGEYDNTRVNGELPNVTLIKRGIRSLKPDERKWMKTPTSTRTIDYVKTLDDAAEAVPEHSLTPTVPPSQPNPPTHRRKHMRIPSSDSEDIMPFGSPHDNMDSTALPPSSSTSQKSAYPISCRCGLGGDGHTIQPDEGMLMCEDCFNWSHIACQRGGRASALTHVQKFICDNCMPYKTRMQRRSSTRTSKAAAPLSKRLLAGKGALVRIGKYWYPVRLIQHQVNQHGRPQSAWHVKLWRACKFPPGTPVNHDQVVNEQDIVDELWRDHTGRRAIRLGQWTHASQALDAEDFIMRFLEVPFPAEIHQILSLHTTTLHKLLEHPHPDNYTDLPVGQYLSALQHAPSTTGGYSVKFCGEFTDLEYAQIANWFYHNIPGAQSVVHTWLGCAPLAHALTLVITQRQYDTFKLLLDFPIDGPDDHKSVFVLQRAWEYLDEKTGTMAFVDVDLECLTIFEERMFENSVRAGIAGNQQWGLDSGNHQGGWNPYADLPTHWSHGDRDYSETELERGPEFSEGSIEEASQRPPSLPPRKRVKPRRKGARNVKQKLDLP